MISEQFERTCLNYWVTFRVIRVTLFLAFDIILCVTRTVRFDADDYSTDVSGSLTVVCLGRPR